MRWIALQAGIEPMTGNGPGPEPTLTMSEAAAQQVLASMALGFTPRVALVDEAVLMEVSGSLRLFGGLARLAQLLEQQVRDFFESHRVPVWLKRAQGATSLIALGRLRLAGPASAQTPVQTVAQTFVQTASTPRRVADLPLHTLSATHPHLGVLARIGCSTWDDLLRLPRDGLARRFGAPLLQALDRARGHAPDVYTWQVLPEQFEDKLELDALITHAPALMAGAERLLMQLQAWLLGRQSGLSACKLTWYLDKRRDVPPTGELFIRTAQPVQDLRHLARLMAEQLARQRLPAPVHSLSLQSVEVAPLVNSAAATASLLMQTRKQGDSAIELIERLSARLGPEQVQAWQALCDHRPEQMQQWVNAQTVVKTLMGSRALKHRSVKSRTAKLTQLAHQTPASKSQSPRKEALYPSWLLAEPLKLATYGNSPVYQGRLVRLAGPQRLELAGWLMANDEAQIMAVRSNPPAIRDYFIYRSMQAGLLWIYSERLTVTALDTGPAQRAWYLHGFFA